MTKLTHAELIVFLLAISVMLIFSRIAGELGKRLKLPVVMGYVRVYFSICFQKRVMLPSLTTGSSV
jgi:hypothetical protein